VGLRRGFGTAAVGTSSASPYGGLRGGRRFLSLSAAGWRRWFKSEDAAEHLRPPLRRDFGETAEDGRQAESRRASPTGGRDADHPAPPS
jgi:hypothetical protein